MIDFGRSDRLARSLIVGAAPAATVYTAVIETEISLVMVAATGGDLLLDMHLLEEGESAIPLNQLLAAYPVPTSLQGPVFASQSIGNGITVKPGQSLAFGSDVDCTVTLFGTTTALLSPP